MAKTIITDGIDPEILTEAVQGAFAGKNAFMGSFLVAVGAAIVDGSFPESNPKRIGTTVEVPYFGVIGPFVNNPDGSAVTPQKLQQTSETAVVSRDSLAFEVTRWAENGWRGDPYAESARQINVQATRAMDKRLIDCAVATGAPIKSRYAASAITIANYLDWDAVIDARAMWGDEDEMIVGMVMNSAAKADVLKLKDGEGRPLMVPTMNQGDFDRFAGLPMHVSDRMSLDGSSMGAVTAAGTAPPTVTLAGTPMGGFNLVIDVVVGGLLAATTVRFSTDGGQSWSATMPAAASLVLTDTAVDSIVGVNGETGITATMAAGTYNADNTYESEALLKARTLLLKRGALAFWYNRDALELLTDKDILADSRLGAMHLYGAAHRYRRIPGGPTPGVIIIEHNVSAYTGTV
jgi:hypothetical protein